MEEHEIGVAGNLEMEIPQLSPKIIPLSVPHTLLKTTTLQHLNLIKFPCLQDRKNP